MNEIEKKEGKHLYCDCWKLPQQQERDGHTRYCALHNSTNIEKSGGRSLY